MFDSCKDKKNCGTAFAIVQIPEKNISCNLKIVFTSKIFTIMKTRTFGLMAIMMIASTIQGMARQRIQVEAVNNDISYYLDLKAIASIFGDSRDLEDFERRINDYDSQISNLDLNSDGDVDYLRVIETSENNTHLVVIQAILDRDVYQDVATVVVERDQYRRSYVQIIGDPYIYGQNYIIEPVFYQTPFIVSWFWTPRYHSWFSPYSWGYYPRHYRYRHPLHIDLYLSHIHGCINYSHHYRYNDNWRSQDAYRIHNSISRNDYSTRYPERSYNKRNSETVNRYEMDKRRNSDYVRMPDRSIDNNNSHRNSSDNVYDRSSNRKPTEERNSYGTRIENPSRTSESNRAYEPTRQNRESNNAVSRGSSVERNQNTYNNGSESRKPTITRESNTSRQEERKSEPKVSTNSNSTSRGESVRTSRPATENKTVERSSSTQRSSTPSKAKSESTRSSDSGSKSESGRR